MNGRELQKSNGVDTKRAAHDGAGAAGGRSRARQWLVALLGVVVLSALTACEDPAPLPGETVLAEVEQGYGKQAILNRLPEGPGADTSEGSRLENGYRLDRYFLEGRPVEVLWIRDRADGALADLERHEANPVIFIDQVLDGWGWEHFDERAAEWSIVDQTSPAAAEEAAPLLHEDERDSDGVGS